MVSRTQTTVSTLVLILTVTSVALAGGGGECPPDAVRVGPACVDKYEASVWQIVSTNKALVKKVLAGKATLGDLSGGATLIGCQLVPDAQANYPDNFPINGQWTPVPGSDPPSPGVYAVSVAGVRPTTCTSWFQAAQACRLAGKRLVRNDEWQDAAAGTPDPGTADDHATTCNTTRPSSAVDLVLYDARSLRCRYVFHGPDCGRTPPSAAYGCVGDFKKAWAAACQAAGFPVGRKHGGFVFHNTRHTAVTNLVNAGVPAHEAMTVSGHRTRSVFDRYSLTLKAQTRGALERVTAYTQATDAVPVVHPLRGARRRRGADGHTLGHTARADAAKIGASRPANVAKS
jgi:hypothetical protein